MTTQTDWAEALDRLVDERQARLTAVRRHLHAHPELSGHETATTAYLAERLREAGLDTLTGPRGTGLLVDGPVVRREGTEGPACVALRADLDALPIQDLKECEYRSRVEGVMHACGHDGHAAVLLGAVLALHEAWEEGRLPWPVSWRAIFQPAEETALGALEMIESGALEGVAAILSMHLDPSRPTGVIGVRDGAFTADCVELYIEVHGRGGHAARPHELLDPIAAAAHLVSSVYLFVPRAASTNSPVVVSFGQMAGGHSPNVIPDQVVLRGTLRTFGSESRQRTLDHIRRLAGGIGEAAGVRIDVEDRPGPPSVYNDPEMTALIRRAAVDLLDAGRVVTLAEPSMGGEDFANYLNHVPGAMFRLGCAQAGRAARTLHASDFDFDEEALSVGAKVLARAAVRFADPQRPPFSQR